VSFCRVSSRSFRRVSSRSFRRVLHCFRCRVSSHLRLAYRQASIISSSIFTYRIDLVINNCGLSRRSQELPRRRNAQYFFMLLFLRRAFNFRVYIFMTKYFNMMLNCFQIFHIYKSSSVIEHVSFKIHVSILTTSEVFDFTNRYV